MFVMFYSGDDDTKFRTGRAISMDGVTWEKDPLNPVMGAGNLPDRLELLGVLGAARHLGWEPVHDVEHQCRRPESVWGRAFLADRRC